MRQYQDEHGNPLSPDIQKYSIHDLESIHDIVHGVKQEAQQETIGEVPGTTVVYNIYPFRIIKIEKGADLETIISAVCHYSGGTRWCTSNPKTVQSYLNQGPIFIIFEKGHKVGQAHPATRQVMDLQNKPIPIKSNLSLWQVLLKVGAVSELTFKVKYASWISKKRVPEIEQELLTLLTSEGLEGVITDIAEYASNVMGGKWPEAEEALLEEGTDQYNIEYAEEGIKGQWPALESMLLRAGSPFPLVEYATRVLKRRWPEAEPMILKNGDPEDLTDYAVSVIKGRWPEAEQIIRTELDEQDWEQYQEKLGGIGVQVPPY
jgi:hypothetical protein